MRYEAHPVFAAPVNADATIWRYMDFAKLVSLLKTRSLYFARVDALGDEFEGFYSRANIEMRPAVYHDKIPETTLAEISAFTESQRKRTFVNCWNLSEYESGALWGLYVPPHGGVAIRSTFRRLTQCFQRTPEDHAPGGAHEIYIGQVEYADYDSAWLPEGNTLWPFVFKRRSFDFEMELRACIGFHGMS